MKKYRVIISNDARRQLRTLYDTLVKEYGEYSADVVQRYITWGINQLETAPYIYREMDNFPGYRSKQAGRYRIIYVIDEERGQVVIFHVVHVHRDLRKVLK